jgi:hypothetical protein
VDTTLRAVHRLLDRLGALVDTLPLLASGERAVALAAQRSSRTDARRRLKRGP